MVNKIGTIEFTDSLLIALGSTQFDIQTYNIYKYYRYNYFFTYVSDKIDMKKEFYKKFNVDYNSFLELGSILSFFCSLKVNLDPQILRYIIFKYSKATSLLILSREAFQKEIDKISDYVIQLYKQLHEDFNNKYNFFENDKEIIFNYENCFGVVVLLEESYIRRELIYINVAKKLDINIDSKLYNWIINHIKVCNLYDIERYVFTNTDIIKALKKQIKEKSPYNYALSNSKTNSILKNDNVYSFKKNISNSIKEITNELVKVGLMKKNE